MNRLFAVIPALPFVIPAKAGIQLAKRNAIPEGWIPAFAGMTREKMGVPPCGTQAGRACQRKALTLVEMLVVVAVLMILLAMLMPALTRARATAESAFCINNLRQIGVAGMAYSGENGGYLSPNDVAHLESSNFLSNRWFHLVAVYMSNDPHVFECPSAVPEDLPAYASGIRINGQPSLVAYGQNNKLCGDQTINDLHDAAPIYSAMPFHLRAEVTHPARTVMITDANNVNIDADSANEGAVPQYTVYRHTRKTNVLMVDGHVEPNPSPLNPAFFFTP